MRLNLRPPTLKKALQFAFVLQFTTLNLCNMTNTRESVSSGYPNTEKRVENTTRSRVFFDEI